MRRALDVGALALPRSLDCALQFARLLTASRMSRPACRRRGLGHRMEGAAGMSKITPVTRHRLMPSGMPAARRPRRPTTSNPPTRGRVFLIRLSDERHTAQPGSVEGASGRLEPLVNGVVGSPGKDLPSSGGPDKSIFRAGVRNLSARFAPIISIHDVKYLMSAI